MFSSPRSHTRTRTRECLLLYQECHENVNSHHALLWIGTLSLGSRELFNTTAGIHKFLPPPRLDCVGSRRRKTTVNVGKMRKGVAISPHFLSIIYLSLSLTHSFTHIELTHPDKHKGCFDDDDGCCSFPTFWGPLFLQTAMGPTKAQASLGTPPTQIWFPSKK